MNNFFLNIKYFLPHRFIFGTIINLATIYRFFINRSKIQDSAQVFSSNIINNIKTSGFNVTNIELDMSEVSDIELEFQKSSSTISLIENKLYSGIHPRASTFYLKKNNMKPSFFLEILNRSQSIDMLEQAYRTKFECFHIALMKTTSCKANLSTSLNFHRDGHPPFAHKLIVYLTDVYEPNGPTMFCKGSHQKTYLTPTYGLHNFIRPSSKNNFETIIGPAGTCLLFNNNGIHAGGRTKTSDRIIAVFTFRPGSSIKNFNDIKSVGEREYSLN